MFTEVIDTIDIHADPAVVFRHLVEGSLLKKWWPADARSHPEPGGELVLVWQAGNELTTRFDVFGLDRAVGYEFYTERCEFSLAAVATGSALQVRHSGIAYDEQDVSGLIHVAQAWGSLLPGLKVCIEHGIDIRV